MTDLVALANIRTLRELSFHFGAPHAGPTAAFLQLMIGINNNPLLRRLDVQLSRPRRCTDVHMLPNMCLLSSLVLASALPVHLVSDRLQALSLVFNGPNALSPPQCLALAGLLHRLPALRFLTLELQGIHYRLADTIGPRLAAGLRGVPTLRTLNLVLSETAVTPFGGNQLYQAICCLPELHTLSISLEGTKHRIDCMRCLSAAPVLRHVALSFAYTQLVDKEVSVLVGILRALELNTLKLDLSFTAITDRALLALTKLAGTMDVPNSGLLHLSHPSGCTSEGLRAFVEAYPHWEVNFRSP